MTQLFDSYTSDIQRTFSTIKTLLTGVRQSPLSKKQSTLPSLKVELYEIEKLIKLMETEIVSFQGRLKNVSAQKIKGFKVEYETMRKRVGGFEEEVRRERSAENEKAEAGQTATSHSLELNQRTSKSSSSSKYSKLSESRSDDEDVNLKLKESVKAMYQIGDMSDNISHQLSTQTGKLQNATSKLGRIRGELMKGEKKIKKIMIRLRRNQLVFYLVILMVVLMAAFVVSRVF